VKGNHLQQEEALHAFTFIRDAQHGLHLHII